LTTHHGSLSRCAISASGAGGAVVDNGRIERRDRLVLAEKDVAG
jgi:hypothetical protein